MQENENIKLIKMLVPIAIYAILTWLWFDLNNSNNYNYSSYCIIKN